MNGRILKRCVNPEGAKKESKGLFSGRPKSSLGVRCAIVYTYYWASHTCSMYDVYGTNCWGSQSFG